MLAPVDLHSRRHCPRHAALLNPATRYSLLATRYFQMTTVLITAAITVPATAFVTWLFLRNNPRIQAKANTLADQAEQLAKSAKR